MGCASSIRRKFALVYLALILVCIAALGLWIERAVRQRFALTVQQKLKDKTAMAAEMIRATACEGAPVKLIASRIARTASCRVTLIRHDGTVIADSHHDPATMNNHGNQPEVQEARSRGTGSSTRFSKTLGVDTMYVAERVSLPDAPVMFVRMAAPMWDVRATMRDIRRIVLLAGCVTAIICGLIAMLLTRSITQPIAEMSRAAERIAAGDLQQRVRVGLQDEVGELASVFNVMSSRLAQMLEEMREDRSRLATILARMADGIIVTNRKGNVVLFNQSAQRIFGVSESETVGRSLTESTMHYELSQMVSECLERRVARSDELQVLQPVERVLDCYVAPVQTEGADHLQGAVVVLHDLTEIRRLERVRKDFVANVSHELRTPVASIRAMTETLLMGAKDERETEERFLRMIHDESARLSNLLDDLLALSAIESDKKEILQEEIMLKPLVDAVIERLARQMEAKELTTTLAVPDDLKVIGDADAMKQILINLIDNAIKYTPQGGTIGVEAEAVEPGPGVTLRVSDTGIGIPSTDIPRIFERFYRVDKTRSREMGGTGLGLSIVKHLVEAHAGSVQVQSEVGKGTTFTLSFPCALR